MGVAYAGAFYCLIDPTFPKERIENILNVLKNYDSYNWKIVLLQKEGKTYINLIKKQHVAPQINIDYNKNGYLCDVDINYIYLKNLVERQNFKRIINENKEHVNYFWSNFQK